MSSFLANLTTVNQLETRPCRAPFWIAPVPVGAIRADLESRGFDLPADRKTIAVSWEIDVRQPNATYRLLEKRHKRGGIDGSIGRMTLVAAAAQLSGKEGDDASELLGSMLDMEPEHWSNEKKRLFAAKTHLVAGGRLVVRFAPNDEESEQSHDLSAEDLAELLDHPNIIPPDQPDAAGKAWEGEPIGLTLLTLVERWADDHKKFVAQVAEEAAVEMGKASDGGSESGSPSTSPAKRKSKTA